MGLGVQVLYMLMRGGAGVIYADIGVGVAIYAGWGGCGYICWVWDGCKMVKSDLAIKISIFHQNIPPLFV